MGWQSSSDTARQVRMRFPNKQTAIAYAESYNIAYQVNEAKSRRIKPRAYADNFALAATERGHIDVVKTLATEFLAGRPLSL